MNEYGPSAGIARNASESDYPGLWRGLAALWCPSAGNQGRRLIDFVAGRHGPMTGQTWVRGRRGSAINFSGSDFITTPVVSLGTLHSACAWIKPAGQTASFNYGALMGDGAATSTSCLVVKSTTDTGIAYSEGAGEFAVAVPSLTGQWHHIASVRNGLSVTLYLDGRAVGSGSLPTNSPATVIYLGSRNNGGINYVGAMDDVRLYTRLLSSQEIMASYMGASPLVRRQQAPVYRNSEAVAPSFRPGIFTGWNFAT